MQSNKKTLEPFGIDMKFEINEEPGTIVYQSTSEGQHDLKLDLPVKFTSGQGSANDLSGELSFNVKAKASKG